MLMLEYVDERILGGLVATRELDLKTLTPNWRASSTKLHGSTGGPGARPRPADPVGVEYHGRCDVSIPGAPWHFKLLALSQNEASVAAVEVAILDTAPPLVSRNAAYTRWREQHPLICSLLRPNGNLRVSHFAEYLENFDTNLQFQSLRVDYGIDSHEYTMFDHGLFATGIIHTIVPHARLHLVEVLNHFGVGTLETLSFGLMRALTERQSGDIPLVINCSLILDVPLEGHPAPDFPLSNFHVKGAFLRRMARPLCYLYDELGWRRLRT